jgi:pyruvate kinase
VVLTKDPRVARQCSSVLSNCRAWLTNENDKPANLIAAVMKDALEKGWCKKGDPIIALYASHGLMTGEANKMKLLFV